MRILSFWCWPARPCTVSGGRGRARRQPSPCPPLPRRDRKSIAGISATWTRAQRRPIERCRDHRGHHRPIHPRHAAKPSNKTYENIAKVEVGLEYNSLIQRFGPAALEVPERRRQEADLSGKDGSTQVEVKEGKVSAVNLPKAQPGVMTLPK